MSRNYRPVGGGAKNAQQEAGAEREGEEGAARGEGVGAGQGAGAAVKTEPGTGARGREGRWEGRE